MTSDSFGGGSGDTDAGDTASESTPTSGTTGEPGDPPPWIDDLACDPPEASEVGPTIVTYKVSADAVEADLLDDGIVIDGPSSGPGTEALALLSRRTSAGFL